jgi:hypothetical protein
MSIAPEKRMLFPISDLTEEDRKELEKQVEVLHAALQGCDWYAQHYVSGEEGAHRFLQDADMVIEMLQEVRGRVIKAHKLDMAV